MSERTIADMCEERKSLSERYEELSNEITEATSIERSAKVLHGLFGVKDFDSEAREWRVKASRLHDDYGLNADEIPRLAYCFRKEV